MSNAKTAPPGDLLYGADAIAEHLHLTREQVYHLHGQGELPTFKTGRTVCALRSALAEHFAQATAAARHG